MSYWTDQKIREDVRRKIQALQYKGIVARAVLADDALDALDDNTAKIDGRFVTVAKLPNVKLTDQWDNAYEGLVILPEPEP